MKIYKVGGCVRDRLLGLTPKDVDYVVVGATPEQMLAQGFEQVGADFPVFLHPETKDEYALARVERKIGVGYHGFETDFNSNVTLEDDLIRRDLTINSMAEDDDGNVIDPYNGQEDLKNRVLRHTSPAFAEDPLRVIRLARFYARYSDFTVDESTIDLCEQIVDSGELNTLSVERFWAEMEKAFSETNVHCFFEFLFMVNANEKVTFFKELLNGLSIDEVRMILSSTFAKQVDKFMTAVVLFSGGNGETIKTASRDIQRCANLFKMSNQTDYNSAEEVLKLLIKSGCFQQGDAFHHFSDVLIYDVLSATRGERSKKFLRSAVKVSSINSEMFADKFEGKALGEAIYQARLEKVREAITCK